MNRYKCHISYFIGTSNLIQLITIIKKYPNQKIVAKFKALSYSQACLLIALKQKKKFKLIQLKWGTNNNKSTISLQLNTLRYTAIQFLFANDQKSIFLIMQRT